MEEETKSKFLGMMPGKKFWRKLLILSTSGWVLIVGTYLLYNLQSRFDTSRTMGAAFGASAGPVSGSRGKLDLTDLNQFDVETHVKHGTRLAEKGLVNEALYHLRRAKVLLRQSPEVSEKIGDCLFKLQKFEAAEEQYRESLDEESENALVMSKLGLSLFYQDRVDEAIEVLEKSVAADSTCGLCYSALGRALSGVVPVRKGATAAYFHSMVAAPNDPNTYYHYARYLMQHQRYDEALPVLKHITDKFPLYTKAHGRLGMTYYYLGQYRNAEREYEVALSMNPEDYNTWYNLGELQFRIQNRPQVAFKSFEKALALEPTHASAHFKTGLILFHNNQYKEAINHFKTSLDNSPQDVKVLLQLAVAYEMIGNNGLAQSVYRNILGIDPLNRIARQKLSIITGAEATS